MNLEQEVRDGYLVTDQMKKVWQVQLNLAKYLLDVCKKNNLKIWAEGGTLLGAVRHKGFIPWDDDMDLMMLREDYDRLINLANAEFKEPYFLQCPQTEPGYSRGHAQLRMSGTTAILPKDIWQNFHQGIFIDIFVYDKLPQSIDSRNKIYSKMESIRYKLRLRNYGSLLCRHPLEYLNTYKEINKNGGYLASYNKMEALVTLFPHKSKKEIGALLWDTNYFNNKSINIDSFRETIYLPFENIEMPVPIGYDDILRSIYGDYMKPVKAPSAHGEVIFDTERSYKDVLKELRRKASLKKKLKHLFSFKLALD